MKKLNSRPAWSAVTRNFENTSEAREIGRVQIIRSVPLRASPAICEPALMDTKIGSSKVKEKSKEYSANVNPLKYCFDSYVYLNCSTASPPVLRAAYV